MRSQGNERIAGLPDLLLASRSLQTRLVHLPAWPTRQSQESEASSVFYGGFLLPKQWGHILCPEATLWSSK